MKNRNAWEEKERNAIKRIDRYNALLAKAENDLVRAKQALWWVRANDPSYNYSD